MTGSGSGPVTGSPGSGGGGTSNPGTGGGAGTSPTGSGGQIGPTGGAGPGPGTGGIVGPVAESAGPLVMRRLTHREYDNTLRDLLGITSPIATNPASPWEADDGSSTSGFEVPTGVVGDLFPRRYMEAADAVAEAAVTANKVTIPCTNPATAAAETTCATSFISTFGRRAFRRPVTAAESADLLAVFNAARGGQILFDFKTSIAQVVKAMIQSPNFLYHWELGPTKPTKQGALVTLTPHQIASRLSYLLWETMPDVALLDAADAGQLSTPDQVAAQAQRLLMDKAKAGQALFNFHVQWLEYPNLNDISKDTKKYPTFTEQFKATLQPEIQTFLSSVLLEGDGTLKTLLTAPYAYVNAATAGAYGVTATGTALVKVDLNPAQRAGLLTQTAFLGTAGSPAASHPIRRGSIVYRQLLCGVIPAFNGTLPDLPKGDTLTTRQQYAMHDMSPCAFCHKPFDPIGFAFENYDGIGVYRTTENGQQVDATGSTMTPQGVPMTFTNAIELSNFLANSEEAKSCAERYWFRYVLGRKEVPADEGSIQAAGKLARTNAGFSVRDLLTGVVKSMTFRMRTPNAGETI
ncbi:MAG: DUF1592 domain-containing protein [Pseudomonadota bacterium]